MSLRRIHSGGLLKEQSLGCIDADHLPVPPAVRLPVLIRCDVLEPLGASDSSFTVSFEARISLASVNTMDLEYRKRSLESALLLIEVQR